MISSSIPKSSAQSFGVYCMANDLVIQWFEAFIRSYQLENAALPLTVIPFNSNIERLRSLQSKFRFEIMDSELCAKFDELAMRVMGSSHAAGMYRKLACFFGPYENFIFLDSDVVVTMPLEKAFAAFAKSNYDFVYFDYHIHAAYTPAMAVKMTAEYGSHGFNAGAFVSRRGLFCEDEIIPLADQAATVREGLVAGTVDQPFFNFIMDVTRRRVAHIDSLLPEISRKAHARQEFQFDYKAGRARTPDGKYLPFIHWPGCAYPTMVRKGIFLKYRTLGMGFWENAAYRARFYYHRIRRNIKMAMLKSALLAKLVAWRESLKKI